MRVVSLCEREKERERGRERRHWRGTRVRRLQVRREWYWYSDGEEQVM